MSRKIIGVTVGTNLNPKKLGGATSYENLGTEDKTLVGAINELAADVKVASDALEAAKTELSAAIEEARVDSDNKDAVVLAEAQDYADAAKAEAEVKAAGLDAALKSELQGEIDADVKVVNDALEGYKTSNDATVALKANAADVYSRSETFTRDEVNSAIEEAITNACCWNEF